MVAPGGNRMMSFKSHKMRCPPLSGSKSPSAVIAHHPQARLAKSRWGSVTVVGPKLKVAAANTEAVERKLRLRFLFHRWRAARVLR